MTQLNRRVYRQKELCALIGDLESNSTMTMNSLSATHANTRMKGFHFSNLAQEKDPQNTHLLKTQFRFNYTVFITWHYSFSPCAFSQHTLPYHILLKLTETLQFDGIIVCPLLTVAFIPGLSVQTVTIFANFLPKQQAFIGIYGKRNRSMFLFFHEEESNQYLVLD